MVLVCFGLVTLYLVIGGSHENYLPNTSGLLYTVVAQGSVSPRLGKITTMPVSTLKTVNCHDANFVITGGIVGCRYDNLRCHQWWQSWHHDESRFSVWPELAKLHIIKSCIILGMCCKCKLCPLGIHIYVNLIQNIPYRPWLIPCSLH